MGKGTEGREARLTHLSFLISCRVAGSPPSLDSSNWPPLWSPGSTPGAPQAPSHSCPEERGRRGEGSAPCA